MTQSMASEDAQRAHRRVIAAGVAGNVISWYDFAVYGYFVRTIGQLYFPADNPSISLMAAYGAFAVGFFMRPLGAVLFGYIGQIVLAGPIRCSCPWSPWRSPPSPSACCPPITRSASAPRSDAVSAGFLQGLAVGGEYTGSVVFLAERAPPGKRGLASAWAPFGAVAGILLGSTMGTAIINAMPMTDVVGWAWRLPFLFGWWWVCRLLHPPACEFRQGAAGQGLPSEPGAMREQPARNAQAVGFCIANAVGFYLLFVYVATWLKLYAQMKTEQRPPGQFAQYGDHAGRHPGGRLALRQDRPQAGDGGRRASAWRFSPGR